MSQWFRMLPGLVDTGAPDQRGQRYGDVEILAGAGGHRLHGGMSGWCQDGVKMVSRWCQDCDKGWCLEDRRLANDQRHVSESEPRHVTGLCRTDCGHRTLAGVGSVVSLIAGGSCATFPADIALVPRYLAGIQIINHCSNY